LSTQDDTKPEPSGSMLDDPIFFPDRQMADAIKRQIDDVRTSSTPTPAVPLANIHAALEQCKRTIAELVRAQIALERMADNQDIDDRQDYSSPRRFGAP